MAGGTRQILTHWNALLTAIALVTCTAPSGAFAKRIDVEVGDDC